MAAVLGEGEKKVGVVFVHRFVEGVDIHHLVVLCVC